MKTYDIKDFKKQKEDKNIKEWNKRIEQRMEKERYLSTKWQALRDQIVI